jgi:hypothetical protein
LRRRQHASILLDCDGSATVAAKDCKSFAAQRDTTRPVAAAAKSVGGVNFPSPWCADIAPIYDFVGWRRDAVTEIEA